mgnify:CR=1 FL=1
MKHQIITSITINADLKTVWEVFTDFESYPNWNPFIKSIKGEIAEGKKFHAEIGGMKFKPTTKVFKLEEFTWLGRLFIPGIFDGRHSFVFEETKDGKTLMIQKEHFKGILVPLMRKKLDTEVLDGFKLMNAELKELAENS